MNSINRQRWDDACQTNASRWFWIKTYRILESSEKPSGLITHNLMNLGKGRIFSCNFQMIFSDRLLLCFWFLKNALILKEVTQKMMNFKPFWSQAKPSYVFSLQPSTLKLKISLRLLIWFIWFYAYDRNSVFPYIVRFWNANTYWDSLLIPIGSANLVLIRKMWFIVWPFKLSWLVYRMKCKQLIVERCEWFPVKTFSFINWKFFGNENCRFICSLVHLFFCCFVW